MTMLQLTVSPDRRGAKTGRELRQVGVVTHQVDNVLSQYDEGAALRVAIVNIGNLDENAVNPFAVSKHSIKH